MTREASRGYHFRDEKPRPAHLLYVAPEEATYKASPASA